MSGEYINMGGKYYDSLGNQLPSPSFVISDSELKNWSCRNGHWEYSYEDDSHSSGYSCGRSAWVEMFLNAMRYAVVFIPVIFCHFPWRQGAGDVHKLVFSVLYAILFISAIDGLIHKRMEKFVGGFILWAVAYALFDRQMTGWGMYVVVTVEDFLLGLLHLDWLSDIVVITRLILLFMLPCSIMSSLGEEPPDLKLSLGAHKALIQFCWMACLAVLSCGWFAIFSSEWKQMLCLVGASILIPLCMGKKAEQIAEGIA